MHSSDVYIYICPDLQHTQTIYQLAFDNWWRKYNSDLITIYYFFTVRPWREQIILNLCLYKVSGQSINGLWHSTLNNSIILGPNTFIFTSSSSNELMKKGRMPLIVSTELLDHFGLNIKRRKTVNWDWQSSECLFQFT